MDEPDSVPIEDYIGRIITEAYIDDDRFFCLKFLDGETIFVYDYASFCCEERFMRCDDDINGSLVGNKLLGTITKEGIFSTVDNDSIDCSFLEVASSGGFITIANYNRHNGFYAGFEIRVTASKPEIES